MTFKNPRYYACPDPEEVTDGEDGKAVVRFLATLTSVNVKMDGFGRVYLDTCKDDHEHLTGPTDPAFNRKGCRVYVEEIFEHLVGKKGGIYIAIDFKEDKK